MDHGGYAAEECAGWHGSVVVPLMLDRLGRWIKNAVGDVDFYPDERYWPVGERLV